MSSQFFYTSKDWRPPCETTEEQSLLRDSIKATANSSQDDINFWAEAFKLDPEINLKLCKWFNSQHRQIQIKENSKQSTLVGRELLLLA